MRTRSLEGKAARTQYEILKQRSHTFKPQLAETCRRLQAGEYCRERERPKLLKPAEMLYLELETVRMHSTTFAEREGRELLSFFNLTR